MDIEVHSRNFDITEGLRKKVNQKLSQITRHLTGITDIRVELASEQTRSQKQRIIAQVTLDADGSVIRSEQSASSMLRLTWRWKHWTVKSPGTRTALIAASTQSSTLHYEPQQAEAVIMSGLAHDGLQLDDGDLVRVKRFPMEPMSVEEDAFRTMEMLGHSFFMFLNREDVRHHVLYQRDDGNYGFIQPEG